MRTTEIAKPNRIMGKISRLAARLFALIFTLQLCPLSMGQISADQASSAISILMKQHEKSACDGELLDIQCNDDYVIEIITAELTILHWDQQQTVPVGPGDQRRQRDNNKVATSAEATRTNSRSSSNDNNQTGSGPVESSPSLASLTDCAAPADDGNSRGQTGNGTRLQANTGGVCNETESLSATLERKAKFLTLVRKQCLLHNNCTIDLRLGPPIQSGGLTTLNSVTSISSSNTNTNNNNSGNHLPLGQFLNERCPANRKLFEMVYKCRPMKYRAKSACRDTKLTLECPKPNERLAIGAAHFGYLADDKKTNERCLLEEAKGGGGGGGGQLSARSPATCGPGGGQSTALSTLTRECLFKSQCQLQVTSGLFASCATTSQIVQQDNPHHLEYLKLVYVCIHEQHLVTTNQTLVQRSLLLAAKESGHGAPASGGGGGPLSESRTSSFNSQNVSAASQRVSPSPPPHFILPPANVNANLLDAPDNGNADDKSPFGLVKGTRLVGGPIQNRPLLSDSPLTVIESDPELWKKHPSEWTLNQRVKYLVLRYQNQLVAFAVITITISTLVALLVRLVCQRKSTRQSSTSSSVSSKSLASSADNVQKCFGSSSSSSSSNTTNYTNQTNCTLPLGQQQQLSNLNAYGGTQTNQTGGSVFNSQRHLAAATHQNNCYKTQDQINQLINKHNQHHLKVQPSNSCSESCFSLEDCKHGATFHQMDTPINNNSPALQSNQTTPPLEVSSLGTTQEQQQQPRQNWASTLASNGARPKLWSFYVNEQHSNSLRLNGFAPQQQQQQSQHQMVNNNTNTLRAQRTFSNQPQPTMARNFECLQRQEENASNQLEPHQSDYLLAMASVGQQRHQLGGQLVGPMASSGWCEHQNMMQDNEQRLRLLTLNPSELLEECQHQRPSSNNNTCAYHSQQQHQMQHQISYLAGGADQTTTTSDLPLLSAPIQFEFEPHRHLDLPPPVTTTTQPIVLHLPEQQH